ncbi:unnamed protein product, partial [Polarella glacialis]
GFPTVAVAADSDKGLAAEDDGSQSDEEERPPPDASEDQVQTRPWCKDCDRPSNICLCSSLPVDGPLETRTRIVMFIHPKEVKRALGTAPLVQLCLRDVVMREGEIFPDPAADPNFHAQLTAGGRQVVLVCPGPDAEELTPLPPEGPGSDEPLLDSAPPRTLIFVDGRWPQAKAMVFNSPWLKEIPRVVLRPTAQSGYVFRQQPGEGCLSTIEAVAEALLALEGQRGPALKEALLRTFRQMVQHQVDRIPDIFDKNANFAAKKPTRPFDAEAWSLSLPSLFCDSFSSHSLATQIQQQQWRSKTSTAVSFHQQVTLQTGNHSTH